VKRGELLAEIAPQEWQADMTFAENTARGSAVLVTQAEVQLPSIARYALDVECWEQPCV